MSDTIVPCPVCGREPVAIITAIGEHMHAVAHCQRWVDHSVSGPHVKRRGRDEALKAALQLWNERMTKRG